MPKASHDVIIGDLFSKMTPEIDKTRWPIIVDPAHEKTMNGKGGMSGAIKAFYERNGKKKKYIRDLLKFPQFNGKRCPNGEVRTTRTDGLHIIHTSAPDLRDKKNLTQGEPSEAAKEKLFQAYYNSLTAAAAANRNSDIPKELSCPILGAGIFKWPMELSAQIAGKALQKFRIEHGNDLQVNFYVHPSALRPGESAEELQESLSDNINTSILDINAAFNQKVTANVDNDLVGKLQDKQVIIDLAAKLRTLKDNYDIYRPLANALQSLIDQNLSNDDTAVQAASIIQSSFDAITNYDEEIMNTKTKPIMRSVIEANLNHIYEKAQDSAPQKNEKVRFMLPEEQSAAASSTVTPVTTPEDEWDDLLTEVMIPSTPTVLINHDSDVTSAPDLSNKEMTKAVEMNRNLKVGSPNHKDSIIIMNGLSEDILYNAMKSLTGDSVDKMLPKVQFLRQLNEVIRQFGEGNRTLGDVIDVVEKSNLVSNKNANPLQVLADGIQSVVNESGMIAPTHELRQIHEIVRDELSEPLNLPIRSEPITLSSNTSTKQTVDAQAQSSNVTATSTAGVIGLNVQTLYNAERENVHKEKNPLHAFARNVVKGFGMLKSNEARENQIAGLQALVDNFNNPPGGNRENAALQLYCALNYVKYEIRNENNKFTSSLALVCDQILKAMPESDRASAKDHIESTSPGNIEGVVNSIGSGAIAQTKQTEPTPDTSNKNKL